MLHLPAKVILERDVQWSELALLLHSFEHSHVSGWPLKCRPVYFSLASKGRAKCLLPKLNDRMFLVGV